MRQFSISIFHSHAEKTVWNNWKVNKLIKKRDASLRFLDAQFVLYTNAPVYTNVLTPDTITWLFVCCPLIKISRRCHLQIRMIQAQWKSLRGRELHKARTVWIYMQCCTVRPAKIGLFCKTRPPVSFVMSKFQKQTLVKVPFHFVSQQKARSSAAVFDVALAV